MSQQDNGHFIIETKNSTYYAEKLLYFEGFVRLFSPLRMSKAYPQSSTIYSIHHSARYGLPCVHLTLGANGVEILHTSSMPDWAKRDEAWAQTRANRKWRVAQSYCHQRRKNKRQQPSSNEG